MSPSSCCPPGSWPALQSDVNYQPQGQITDLGDGVEAYIVKGNETNSHCLLSFQDIFAFNSARHFPVVDQFATAGFTVVHVNFLQDDYYQGDFTDFPDWIRNHAYDKVIQAKLQQTVLPYISTTLDFSKVGTIGFCYGSYMSFMAAADDTVASLLAAGVGFHPSHKGHTFVDPKDPECNIPAKAVKMPQLLVAAGNDPDFVKPEGSLIKTLHTSHSPSSKAVVFDNMSHGWVNRGDVADPAVQEGVKTAIELAVSFLKKHMA
uniref:Dienelactone hydrolase domain-containing protein n=1 Tax=Amphora coffeiformis TaxID=265554 RepID=A0A7S3LF62_9STRA|mmetsp:Transcript_24950/g.47380  ORF Transcript_24950/g.47380 Transcript_24950/m.47380 type:complete len:262 (+) Transcript_24950:77-862(+)|eukprot:scaffold1029_cov194-Amphora_coffeaeformis.AAC.14